MLPLYGSVVPKGDSLSMGRWIYSFLKTTLKEILKNSDSRNIFLFLVLNLMFMFIEMLYGYWTNRYGVVIYLHTKLILLLTVWGSYRMGFICSSIVLRY